MHGPVLPCVTSNRSFLVRTSFYSKRSISIRQSLVPVRGNRFSVPSICDRQVYCDNNGGLDGVLVMGKDEGNILKLKDWEIGMLNDEIAASQGIKIRRRKPTSPPFGYLGSFQFCIQEESSPRNILEEITWHKDIEISQLKERFPLTMLEKSLGNAPPARDFVRVLKDVGLQTGLPALIAEVKKASPSRGVLREDFDPVKIAQSYEQYGAACLSVLTDEKYFLGSFENLVAIRNAGIKCPLLCKEFIIDVWQIWYARMKGADAVLLIAAILPDHDIKYMTMICKTLGMAALVEVHNEREMDRVLGIEGIELIGINNRNLETFEVDINNTRILLDEERRHLIHQKGIIAVGESGLFTPEDISYVQDAGIQAVLVGESLMKQSDPGRAIVGLFGRDISR